MQMPTCRQVAMVIGVGLAAAGFVAAASDLTFVFAAAASAVAAIGAAELARF